MGDPIERKEATIVQAYPEGEVAPEHATLNLILAAEGNHDEYLLGPAEAQGLMNSAGVTNYEGLVGKTVTAEYTGSRITQIDLQ